ncbi:MAG: GAF domain-containing protein [SAR324 cluster bacterium]|nr:GAF domain-containing protein [SAR324 cluster bacterium]
MLRWDLIFPYTVPIILTVVIAFFLASITIKTGRHRRDAQLFTIYCILQGLEAFNELIDTVSLSPSMSLNLLHFIYLPYVFIVPVALHFIHEILAIKHWFLVIRINYTISLLLMLTVPTSWFVRGTYQTPQGVEYLTGPGYDFFVIYAGVSLIYAIALLWSKLKASSHKVRYVLLGMILNAALTLTTAIPTFGINIYPPGNFGFIPLLFIAYGILEYRLFATTRNWFNRGHYPRLIVMFFWLPVLVFVLFMLAAANTHTRPEFWTAGWRYAIPPVTSLFVCLGLASFCFLKIYRDLSALLLGVFFALLGWLNLNTLCAFILKDATLVNHIALTTHAFLVAILPIGLHFVYLLLKRDERRLIYLLYGLSLLLMYLVMTPWYAWPQPYTYSFGYYLHGKWPFNLFGISGSLATLWACWLLRKSWLVETDSLQKKRILFVFLGNSVSALLTLGNIPLVNGIDFYPTATWIFIPGLLMAYGMFHHEILSMNLYTKRRLKGQMVRLGVILGYFGLFFIILWVVREHSWQHMLTHLNWYVLPPFISVLICGLLSILALYLGQHTQTSQIFSIICTIYAFLNTEIFLNNMVNSAEQALTLSRLSHFFLVLILGLTLHFLFIVFRITTHRWLWKGAYLAGLIMLPLTQTSWYFGTSVKMPWGWYPQGNIAFLFMCLGWLVYTPLAAWLIYRKYHTMKVTEASVGSQWIFPGTLGAGVFTLGNIPGTVGYQIYPLGSLIFIPFLFIAYGLFRHNLQNALQISRKIVLWSATLSALGLLGVSLKLVFPTNWGVLAYWVVMAMVILGYKVIFHVLNMLLKLFWQGPDHIRHKIPKLNQELSQSRSLKELGSVLANHLGRLLSTRQLSFLVFDAKQQAYTGWQHTHAEHVFFGSTSTTSEEWCSIPADHALLEFMEDRHLIQQEEWEEWLLTHPASGADQMRNAWLIVPVFYQETICALMLLGEKLNGNYYSDAEKNFLAQIGFGLGAHIENTRLLEGLEHMVEERTRDLEQAQKQVMTLYEQSHQHELELEHMNQVLKMVSSTLNLRDVMDAVMEGLQTILDFNQLGIFLVEPDKKTIRLADYYGKGAYSREQAEMIRQISIPLEQYTSYIANTILDKETKYISPITPTLSDYFFPIDKQMYDIHPVKAYLLVPISVQQEVIGVMVFVQTITPFELNESDLQRIERYVPQVAIAIHNAHLYQELKTTQIQLAGTEKIAAMTRTFEKFVPRQFLKRLAVDGMENIQLGNAESEELSILFSDIRDFTSFSETLTPQELLNFLNAYFKRMNNAIHDNYGFIDKFIGDAIMALFDYPEKDPVNSTLNAVNAAIAMQQAVQLYNQHRESVGYSPVRIGIGLHRGPVVIGTVGGQDRMDSTVVGDTVNIAARMEGLTKYYGASIIVSRTVRYLMMEQKHLCFRELDWIQVKGKTEATGIYEVFNHDPPHILEMKNETRQFFSAGLFLRYERKWWDAIKMFEKSLSVFPEDRAAMLHIRQCEQLQARILPENWNGAVIMDIK